MTVRAIILKVLNRKQIMTCITHWPKVILQIIYMYYPCYTVVILITSKKRLLHRQCAQVQITQPKM